MAVLDDLLASSERIESLLENLLDAMEGVTSAIEGMDGGGGAGAAASGSAGGTANKGGSLGSGRGKRLPFGGSLAGAASAGFAAGGAAVGPAFSAARSLGLEEAARQVQLGGNTRTVGGAFAAGIAGTATQGVGGAIFANTATELGNQQRAQSTVSGLAESVARAGGNLNEAGLRQALRGQQEIEGRVGAARNLVGRLSLEEGQGRLATAGQTDLESLGRAVPILEDIANMLSGLLGSAGGGR